MFMQGISKANRLRGQRIATYLRDRPCRVRDEAGYSVSNLESSLTMSMRTNGTGGSWSVNPSIDGPLSMRNLPLRLQHRDPGGQREQIVRQILIDLHRIRIQLEELLVIPEAADIQGPFHSAAYVA